MAEQTAVQTAKEPGPKIVKYESLADRVDSIFQEIAGRAYEIFESNGCQEGHAVDDWMKAERQLLRPVGVEVRETDQELEVIAEVPGFTEKELEVSVEPERVTITGKRESSKEEKKGKTVYSETSATDILRTISLPMEVDAEKASATLKDGVLILTLPKVAKAQVVRVKSAAA